MRRGGGAKGQSSNGKSQRKSPGNRYQGKSGKNAELGTSNAGLPNTNF
jgi:hypothetical protein